MFRKLMNPIGRSTILLAVTLFITVASVAQSKKEKIITDASAAKAEFIKTDPKMAGNFESAYGYVIFPNVGKGAVGVGGASGNGVAYEQGAKVGMAKLTQVTIGFQWGGQAYSELIFFEDKETLDRFKANKVEFSAQVSAVAATAGALASAR